MTGILLINLGTPEAPRAREVGTYLREFLMDPMVIDIPFPLRWFLVNVLIVPKRSPLSASQYEKVWTDRGSPLLFHTVDLGKKVREKFGAERVVEIGMRYGNPSIKSALEKLVKGGATKIVAFPLYPQYSLAATESSVVETKRAMQELGSQVPLEFLPAFYDESAYLDAVAEVSRPYLEKEKYDMALFSFHGLPERQVKRTDASGSHCLSGSGCCDVIGSANQNCYRAQCYATAKGVAERLGISKDKYRVCFQSRLGRTPWIKPYTDEFYRELPAKGVKRVVVLCPSFVADCLETLEEVSIRGEEEFVRNGGEKLTLVPSLNSSDVWAEAVTSIVRGHA